MLSHPHGYVHFLTFHKYRKAALFPWRGLLLIEVIL